jgi:hypothetical protein
VRIAAIELLLDVAQRSWPREERIGDSAADARRRNAGACERGVERHRDDLARIR